MSRKLIPFHDKIAYARAGQCGKCQHFTVRKGKPFCIEKEWWIQGQLIYCCDYSLIDK